MKKEFSRSLTATSPFTLRQPNFCGLGASLCGLRAGPDIFALRRRIRPRSSSEVS